MIVYWKVDGKHELLHKSLQKRLILWAILYVGVIWANVLIFGINVKEIFRPINRVEHSNSVAFLLHEEKNLVIELLNFLFGVLLA